MDLFIDTNVFLSFFYYSSDDLEQLKKLIVLLRNDRFRLILPEQVIDEFRRNREKKIADALKRFSESRLTVQFPQMCKDYPEYEGLQTSLRDFARGHEALRQRMLADAETASLKADELIKSLFAVADRIEITPELREQARRRREVGNPPGKNDKVGSLGDALNWEAVLQTVQRGQDLYLVSGDGDYCSELDDTRLHGYLRWEWEDRKRSQVVFFKQLRDFFRAQFPQIELAEDVEEALAIRDLVSSRTFADTHDAVRRLAGFKRFSPAHLNMIVSAALNNNQVYWIAGDEDVHQLLSDLVSERAGDIEPSALEQLEELLEESEVEPEEDGDE